MMPVLSLRSGAFSVKKKKTIPNESIETFKRAEGSLDYGWANW